MTADSNGAGEEQRARGIASMVIGLAVGSSLTPWVPVPFVDDWIYERLLRRIARKVMDKGGLSEATALDGQALDQLAARIAEVYLKAGDPSFGAKVGTTLARFVVRKVAIILDVKKTHDVFGESIAFAMALDSSLRRGAVHPHNADAVGLAIHRAMQSVGSAPIEGMTRAGREAFAGGKPHERVVEAIGRHIDDMYARLDHVLSYELR